MRKIFITLLMAFPMMTMAQSNWELPDAQKDTTEQVKKKEKKSNGIEPKYAEGAVPLVDGKPEWDYTIKVKGSIDELYKRTLDALTELTKQPNQHQASRITAVNKEEHIVAAYCDEDLLLKKQALARDFTDFRYTLIATVKKDEVEIRLCRISYAYDVNRHGGVYTAEEVITDENAFNKKHTKFYPFNGKFRRKTIDRKDEIFSFLEQKIKQK